MEKMKLIRFTYCLNTLFRLCLPFLLNFVKWVTSSEILRWKSSFPRENSARFFRFLFSKAPFIIIFYIQTPIKNSRLKFRKFNIRSTPSSSSSSCKMLPNFYNMRLWNYLLNFPSYFVNFCIILNNKRHFFSNTILSPRGG